jgi:sec-independent protein translocase protein TatA
MSNYTIFGVSCIIESGIEINKKERVTAMFGLGTQELIIILLIVGVLFGAKKLPELGKGLGQAIKGFKKSIDEPDEKEILHEKPGQETSEKVKSKEEAKV